MSMNQNKRKYPVGMLESKQHREQGHFTELDWAPFYTVYLHVKLQRWRFDQAHT